MLDIHKDVLSGAIKQTKSKSMVGKDEINSTTKSKRKPAVVKDELTKNVSYLIFCLCMIISGNHSILYEVILTMKLCFGIKFLQALDHQKDVTEKVAKAKKVIAKDELTSTTKTKAKPDANESTEKVTVISYYFGRGQV